MRNLAVKGSVMILMGGALCLTNVYAEALKADLKVFEVVNNKKKELKATDEVKPNSLLEYQVVYNNTTNSSLKNLKLNLPLPSHVTYTGVHVPANVYASIDGVKFAKVPLTRVVNGKKVNIPYSEYRALQWHVTELKAKQKTTVSAQARVNSAE